MKYVELGNTSIEVSKICLGTMTWGEQNTSDQAFEQLDLAMESGINFIDTAELYPIPPKGETYGDTEYIIGDWMQKRNNRDEIILASKVCGKSNWTPHIREGKACFDRSNINAAIDASLTRLKTDYIDLYQLHWPDRNSNFFGKLGYIHAEDEDIPSMEETLETLDDLVKAGKIRHIGLSNETPWGTMQMLKLAEQKNLPKIVSIQNPYSLLNRSFEIGLAEIACREKVGLLPYSPLGFGVLSGKYLDGKMPNGSRLKLFREYNRYTKEQGVKATEAYVALAKEHNLKPAQMALAFCNTRPFVTSTIVGATTLEQLEENIESIDVELSDEVLDGIEQIHIVYSNPSP
jgi:aryl-alcohol dehydrogenase-like predicted oxidoreductase